MKKVLVLTGTRAEYGLLYWTMKEIQNDDYLELQLVVTGNHLVKEYGYTVEQIKSDGFIINEEIDMLIDSEKQSSIIKSMAIEMIQLAQCFDRLKPDLLLILGDRYETFVAATCAMMMNIPIAHMNGGESTEGAVDEQIRHAITKMAHLHFTGADYYRDRLLKMGEESWRVFNVGQSSIENIKRMNLLSKEELYTNLKIPSDKSVFLITYHPETLDVENTENNINTILDSLHEFNETLIFTYPNADYGSKIIIEKINDFLKLHKNAYFFQSLGQLNYTSLLQYAGIMIGNSSSGIIESPYFKLPVVNIGSRQKGRLRNLNIIDEEYNKDNIVNAINKAQYDYNFRNSLKTIKNVYGEGNVSKEIVHILKYTDFEGKIMKKKLTY